MAGSMNHLVDRDGRFTMEFIENMGDAHEALEECFDLIYLLARGCSETVGQACRALGYPDPWRDKHDPKAPMHSTRAAPLADSTLLTAMDEWGAVERCHLFYVQDADRPVYVLAPDWQAAVKHWQAVVATENEIPIHEVEGPDGIQRISEGQDLLVDIRLAMKWGREGHQMAPPREKPTERP